MSENKKEIDNILDENSEINKIESKIFVLKNLFYKKEHEILNLETFLKNLKKRKNSMAIEIRNCDDTIFSKILNDELVYYRNDYTKMSKWTISEKSKIKEKKRKIEELKKEIEICKNPQTFDLKARSSLSEYDIERKYNLNLNSNNVNNADNADNAEKISLKNNNHNYNNLKENKTEIIYSKNDDSTLLKLNLSCEVNNSEETLNKLFNELKNNKDTIKNLNKEILTLKSANSKKESDISEMNNLLSNKFCLIYKLEKKLDKAKNKKNICRDINENVDEDKIHKKISFPILNKLSLNNTSEFSNLKTITKLIEKKK